MFIWTEVAVGEVPGDCGGVGQRNPGVCVPGIDVGDEPEGVAVAAGGLAAGVAG